MLTKRVTHMQPTRMQKMAIHGQPARTNPRDQSERGIALLGTTLVLAIVMGLLVWGTLVMARQSAVSAYQVNNANQARTAALIGIAALTQYANQAATPTASASSSSSSSSGGILGVLSSLLAPGTSVPNGGSGGVALNVPVGTNAETAIAFSAPYMAATVSAVVTANTFSASGSIPGQIVIMSQGASGTARATAVAVLAATSATGSSAAQAEVPINLNGGTSFSGNVQLEGGQNASLAVNGSVTASGSFSGFNNSSSTGSASYSGSTSGMNLFSNSNITITGSAQYNSIQSLGNVSISGGVDAVSIQSNGTTTLGSSSTVSNSITSIGNVTLNSSTGAGSVITQGSVTATNASVGITPLTAETVSTPQVTASTMSSLANFAFTPPPSGASSDIHGTVVVQNVTGITAGTYYLYDNGNDNDYICPSDATTPSTFNGPSNACIKIGEGNSNSNADISYSSGTWTLKGGSGSTSDIAPGVLWFQGNVTVSGGTYYDSIIATGAINLSGGNSTSYAVNFANAEGKNVCSNTGYTFGGTTINPSNFCTTPYTNASVGDIGLLSGGDISLGSSAVVYGDIIAGNVINTSGSSTIYGYLTAESDLNDGETNSFGGSTTVDINPINGFTPPPIPATFSSTVSSRMTADQSLAELDGHFSRI